MRGCLLNPFEGFTTAGHPFRPGINMSGQEFGFWFWRVAGIRVQITMFATPSDEGETVPTLNWNRDYFCPVNPFSPAGPIKNEEDQARERTPYCSRPRGLFMPIFEQGEDFQIEIDWCSYASKFAALPDNDGWNIPFDFTVSISSENGVSGAIVSNEPIGPAAAFTTIITGEDLPLTTTYLHEIPTFGGGTQVDSFGGSFLLTPILFYEWRDGADPLYDQFTGALL